MKTVAVLPTGDWAELEDRSDVCIYTMTDEDFKEFEVCSDTALGKCIASYSPDKGIQKY
jgi:hypothetical protein